MKTTLCGLLLCLAGALHGQTTGTIEGAVLDPSGRGAPGARVRIAGSAANLERIIVSDARGRYAAPGLMPGAYTIEVALLGFRGEARQGIALDAGRSLRIDFVLGIGETHEQVVVSAEAPLVSTSPSDWGNSIGARETDTLPLNGRDLFDLASQEPGVTAARSSEKIMTAGSGAHISANGARPNQNSFRLDGIYVNDAAAAAPSSAAGRLLGLEGIQELRLVTSPFSAEYGRLVGAAFTAVSKSGGNELHGSAYEFLRNSALDSRNFFDPAGEDIPALRKNQFGALLGGPLRRNRLFFLGNYEGIRETAGNTTHAATLGLDARNGILPGGRTVRVAPEVAPYLKLYPLPNGREFGDGSAEFVATSSMLTREDYLAGKLDFIPSSRLRFAGRYTFDQAETSTPDEFQVWRFGTDSQYQFIHTETQFVASPQTIHNFRAGFSRVLNAEVATLPDTISPSLSFAKGRQLGNIEVTGLTDFGGLHARLQPRRFVMNDFQFNYDVSHIRGAHNLRLGAGFDRVRFNQVADISAGGSYRFTSIASFLQAQPTAADLMMEGSDTVRGWRQSQFFAFVQDEFRATTRLTVTLGVRYETYSTPTEVQGKIATLRDPLRDPAMTVGGPLFQNPSRDNFAPRAALAWDPFGSGKTVLRAGAGIFFDLLGARELAVAGYRTPPFFNRVYLTNPAFPDLMTAAHAMAPRNSLDGLDYYANQPYAAQFQFALERQLGSQIAVRIGYAGSRGIHLPGKIGNINAARPDVLPDGRLYFPAGAPRLNPAFVQMGFRTMRFNSAYHALLAGFERRWRGGFAFRAKYAWAKSLDENSTAVFDDFLNSDHMPTVFNYGENRGLSAFDLRHCFAANFSYDLPGRGRLAGGWQLHGIFQLQSGNPFSPSVGFDRARILPGSGDQTQRPDFAPAPGARMILGDPQMYYNPLVFALPPAGMYGNLGRNTLPGPGLAMADLALHKPIWQKEGRALNLRLELFNALNHPNFQVPFSQQLFDSGLRRVASAGRITETSTSSRQIQLGLKLVF